MVGGAERAKQPEAYWLSGGGRLILHGPAIVEVVATRSNECRLRVLTEADFEWQQKRIATPQKPR